MTKDDWRCGPNIGRNTNTPWFRGVYDDEDNGPMNEDMLQLMERKEKADEQEKPGV